MAKTIFVNFAAKYKRQLNNVIFIFQNKKLFRHFWEYSEKSRSAVKVFVVPIFIGAIIVAVSIFTFFAK